MSEDKRGSAGGKARALLQKEEAKQRIDEYNQNPNLCKFCNKPLIAPYDKRLYETLKKQFCSISCAAKFNNLKHSNIQKYNDKAITLIHTKSDEEIIEAFTNSSSITEFGYKIGYKCKIGKSKIVCEKLESLK